MERPLGIDIIKNINFSLAIFGTFVSLFGLIIINERLWEWIQIVFYTSILWLIFYGIAKVKSWVVIFILFYSYLGLLRSGLEFFTLQTTNSVDLLKKGILILLTCFYLFQIFIFSKSEVKDYFRSKGKYLIS